MNFAVTMPMERAGGLFPAISARARLENEMIESARSIRRDRVALLPSQNVGATDSYPPRLVRRVPLSSRRARATCPLVPDRRTTRRDAGVRNRMPAQGRGAVRKER